MGRRSVIRLRIQKSRHGTSQFPNAVRRFPSVCSVAGVKEPDFMSPKMRNLTKKYWLIPSHVDWPSRAACGCRARFLNSKASCVISVWKLTPTSWPTRRRTRLKPLSVSTGALVLCAHVTNILPDSNRRGRVRERCVRRRFALSQASRKLRLFSLAD